MQLVHVVGAYPLLHNQGRRPLPKSGGAQGGECGPACKHARSGIAFQK